ncbi:MAG TPA: aldo/keto reductase [archaeon]|nr:aldo/keto reductase [archaeon]
MTENSNIKRKEFLNKCGTAFLGLGLGVSCSKSGEAEEQAQQAREAGIAEAPPREEGPVTPAYRTLGKAKIKVTEVGYGASRTMDPMLINHTLDVGINFLDTGRSYFNGQNEYLLGKLIKGKRDQVVINSKVQPKGLENMQKDLETSLEALGTDYIDSLLIHMASKPEDIESDEIKGFLTRAKEQGKIRTFGFSSHSNFIELLEIAAREPFHEVIMVPYNFMGRYTHMLGGSKKEWDSEALAKAINKCGESGIDFVAIKSCSGGFMKDEQGPQTYRAALKWILQNPYMKSAAAAMGNFQEIEENVRAMGSSKLGEAENKLIERYAALYGAMYCRMCGFCEGQCHRGVRVAEINRLHMYAAGYGGEMARQARRSYSALGRSNAEACESCEKCSVACPYGLPIAGKMVQAHAALV